MDDLEFLHKAAIAMLPYCVEHYEKTDGRYNPEGPYALAYYHAGRLLELKQKADEKHDN